MVGKKVRCVTRRGDLVVGNIYTIIREVNEGNKHFYSVQEILNGHNKFFIDRFQKLAPEVSKNIKIL